VCAQGVDLVTAFLNEQGGQPQLGNVACNYAVIRRVDAEVAEFVVSVGVEAGSNNKHLGRKVHDTSGGRFQGLHVTAQLGARFQRQIQAEACAGAGAAFIGEAADEGKQRFRLAM